MRSVLPIAFLSALATASLGLAAPVAAGPVEASPVEDCDRLAADPAVPLAAIQPQARDACAAALDLDDSVARLLHQYARTLERAGEMAAAERYYGWAADDGYPPARLALERLGRPAGAGVAGTNAGTGAGTDAGAARDPLQAYAADAAGGATGLDAARAIAAAVARDIAPLPHGAALRDPQATLAARRGSAPDMARLLAALIAAGDPVAQTRFGICAPDAATARAAGAAMDRPDPRPAQTMSQAIAAASALPDLPGDGRAVLDRLAAVWSAAVTEGRAEADALAADIRAASPDFGTAPLGLAATPFVTVEVRDGEAWTPLDPLRGGGFDIAACTAYETGHDLPATLTPTLHLTLFATEGYGAGGALPPRRLLAADVPLVSDAVLAFAEGWGMMPPDAGAAPGAQDYTPVLIAGTETAWGDSLRLPRPPSAGPEIADTITGSLGEAAAALSADPSLEPAPGTGSAPAIPDTLRRLDLTVRLDGPSGPGPSQSFALIDRDPAAGPLADANGIHTDFLQIVTFVPLDGTVAGPASADAAPAEFVLSSGGIEAALRRSGGAMAGFDGLRRALFAELSGAAAPKPRTLGLLSTFWTATMPVAHGGADAADATPGLALRTQMLRGIEPATGAEDPASAAAAWAVASVLAERLSLQLGADEFAAAAPRPDAVAVWSAARARGPAHVIDAAADAAAADDAATTGPLSPDAHARATAELSRGRILLAPDAPTERDLAWWSVDPRHAVVEDLFADGGRQAMAEEAKLDQEACRNAGYFASIHGKVARLLAPVALALALSGSGGEVATAIVKYTRAVIEAEDAAEKKRRELELATKACSLDKT